MKKQLRSINFPVPLEDKIEELAEKNKRSFSAQAIYMLETHPDIKSFKPVKKDNIARPSDKKADSSKPLFE